MSAISHPVQDETLSSAEREYARGLMGLIDRELSLHAGRFEGYARDECGVPGDMTYRILTHGYKHRCAMIASHLIANERLDAAAADRLAEGLAADFLSLLKAQIPNSREVVERLDRERGGPSQ